MVGYQNNISLGQLIAFEQFGPPGAWVCFMRNEAIIIPASSARGGSQMYYELESSKQGGRWAENQ